MADMPPPTLRLDFDAAALADNWRALDRMSGTARAGAAVKANCYGLGVKTCVPVLRKAGCRDFFVAHWREVPDLLAHVPPEQIAVLHGPINREEAEYARATGVRPVIDSVHQAQVWRSAGGGPCHLMVDTGINRLGLSPADAAQAGDLEIEVLMSHLACADEDSAANERQRQAFDSVRPLIPHKEASLANSAGIALGPAYAYDLTRPGLALYGGIPRPELAGAIRSVVHPEAALIQIRDLPQGACVGYNATFTAPRAMRVGVLSLGYADGILRRWGGLAFRRGEKTLPILGKVSMDMIVIDLSEAPDLREGDWVRLPYDLPAAADATGLSQYELLTLLGRRFDA